jgi:type II secretion system protein H
MNHERQRSATQGGHRSRGCRSQAFTLIELTVVIVLVGILSALIIPEMRGTYEDAILRSTSRQLMDAFHLAYSRAVSFNQPHRVRLDQGTHRYVVEKRVWENGREDFLPLWDVPGGEGQLDARISIHMRTAPEDSSGPAPVEGMSGVGPSRNTAHQTETTGDSSSITDRQGPIADGLAFYPDGTAEPAEVLLEDRQGFRLLLRINRITAQVRIVEPEPR